MTDLKTEFKYYIEHQSEFVEKYDGKVIVLKNQQVLGAYDSVSQAIEETSKTHPLGTFLVQKVSAGNSDYTATYRSRVAFA